MAIVNSVSNDFYLRSSIVLTFSIAAYPVFVCILFGHLLNGMVAQADMLLCFDKKLHAHVKTRLHANISHINV